MRSIKNILLLDKDPQSAGQIINTLSLGKDAFSVQHAGGVTEGLSYLQGASPDLVLLDGSIAELGDFAAVQTKLAEQNIPCILLSDKSNKNIPGLAEKAGAREYVVKSGITPAHLLKTIVSTLRLSETENRLNVIFEEYSGRISAFSQMLDAISSGAMIVNSDGVMQYCNARASAMMNIAALSEKLKPLLSYRTIKEAEVTGLPDENMCIRASQIEWNNEAANLFIIESTAVQVSAITEMSLIRGLLNSMNGNLILMKGGVLEFVNNCAANTLIKPGAGLTGQRIESLLIAPANRAIAYTEGKKVKGILTLANGSSAAVKYSIGNLDIDGATYQVLEFTLSSQPQNTGAPDEAADTIAVSDMGNFGVPASGIVKDIQLMMSSIAGGNVAQAAKLALLAETGVHSMGNLLGVFKNYLALSDETPQLSEFSLRPVIDEALQHMQPAMDEAGAEINMSELPTVHADRKLVLQVFSELLANALQFSRRDKKPVIDIGHDKYEGSYIFCIRDNGIGISRKDHARIFNPFEKLDATNKNNGLGLAICKSIIEKHGGKIWVESLPGHGSNFYFTLG